MADQDNAGRVTGIGGVFFLAENDNESLARWYEKHLGIPFLQRGGAIFEWKKDTAEDGGSTAWHVAAKDSDWFKPGKARFMINYRVDDMQALLEKLTSAGVEILDGPQYDQNGVFAWIVDPEENKIELWEPMIWDEKNKR